MVNNIPVNGWPQLKDLETVQPILNRLDKIEAWKRTVKEETFTGEEITIDSALALQARSLKTTINAIQDLHGYDKPWVGGAGKNKLAYPYVESSKTVNGLTITVNNDGTVIINGTATANTNLVLADKASLDRLPSGNYIMNGCPAGGATDGSTYYVGFYAPSKSRYDFGSGATISLTGSEDTSANVFIHVSNGYTCNNMTFKPMIRLATESDASFAPYSNICPISGRTAATLTDANKNLFKFYLNEAINSNGTFASSGNFARTDYIERVGDTVSFGSCNGESFSTMQIGFYDANKTFISRQNVTNVTKLENITVPSNTKYIVYALIDSRNISEALCNQYQIQAVENSTLGSYEARITVDATIQLGQTVYGAEVNWDNGTATLVDAEKTITESDNVNWILSTSTILQGVYAKIDSILPGTKTSGGKADCLFNMFKNTPALVVGGANLDCNNGAWFNMGFELGTFADINEFKTWLASNPIQIKYPLATPTTIQLTPEQLEMLKGYNHITLSDGYGTIEIKALTGANWS